MDSDQTLDSWPTIHQAAAALRTSTRSVLRAQDRGEIEIRKRTRPRKKPENVVNPDDLQKLIEKEAPKPHPVRMPAIAPAPQFHPDAFAFTVPALQPAQIDRFLEALQNMTAQRALPAPEEAARPAAPAVPLHLKLWLTLPEASVYSGYSERKLRQAAADGRIHATKDGPRGAIIIRRASLESL
jgi:hypothetical protein